MPCAHCQAVETIFDTRSAERRRREVRKHGLERTTEWLIQALEEEGVEGLSVMDIGAGLGGLSMRLLAAGARTAVLVEASSAFLESARRHADELGLEDCVAWRHGDFVELAPDIAGADVVCLDRVICCYPDMPSLVGLSSARAGKLYGLVLPHRTWWTRLAAWGINATMWLRGSAFRVFVHSPEAVERIADLSGLEVAQRRQDNFWQMVLFRRRSEAAFAPRPAAG